MTMVSRDFLIDEIRAYTRHHKQVPSRNDFRYYSYAIKEFGSWENYVHSAQLLFTPAFYQNKYAWSKEESDAIISELKEVMEFYVERDKKIPSLKDFGFKILIKHLFGTYNTFLETIGYSKANFEKQQLVKKLHDFVDEKDRIPTMKEFGHTKAIYHHFRSFTLFIKENGYTPRQNRLLRYSDKEILDTLNYLFVHYVEPRGKKLTVDEYNEISKSKKLIGINTLSTKSDLVVYKKVFSDKLEADAQKTYTKNFLISELQSLTEKLGRIPKVEEFPYFASVRNQFTVWNDFLEAAGFEPPSNRWTNDYLLSVENDLVHFSRQITGTVKLTDARKHGINVAALVNKHGNWFNTLIELGLEDRLDKKTLTRYKR